MKYVLPCLLLITQWCTAQILKVDKEDIDSDSSNYWMGSLNFDFNINNRSATFDEDVIFRGLVANGDLVYLSKQNAYILISTINYFKSTGGPLISTGYAHFRVNFLRKKKLSYESYSQIQYDDGRRMPYRLLSGGGLRLNIQSKDKMTVHAGTGAMYELERWKAQENDEIIEKTLPKNSSYISGEFTFNEHVNLGLISYYQVGYDKDSDLFRNRISGDAVFKVKVSERLSFLTNFSLQYEDRPIIPINNLVYSLTNGLKWDF